MKSEFNPLKLDVAAFARAQANLAGEWPLSELERLRAYVPHEGAPATLHPVRWVVRGEQRAMRGGAHEVWLHLDASLSLPMECQRCLRPVDEQVTVQRSVRFVADEGTAAELDAESEDDVLVLSRAFDLRWWIEDELILELPLVPRHNPNRRNRQRYALEASTLPHNTPQPQYTKEIVHVLFAGQKVVLKLIQNGPIQKPH